MKHFHNQYRRALRAMSVLVLACASPAAAQGGDDPPTPRFEPQSIDNIDIGYGLAIGDVNGDGRPDILLADKTQFVWYRNPDWTKFVMAENLTKHDNVCIAARDINGDGKVEVAVGGQWNPAETSDLAESGSVHYLMRPVDPTQLWTPVPLHHEPTVHRMRWVRGGADTYRLFVLPLHGRGNVNGEGEGVRALWYDVPVDPREDWTTTPVAGPWRPLPPPESDVPPHMTHNFDVVDVGRDDEHIIIAGREGLFSVGAKEAASTGSARRFPRQVASAAAVNGAGEVSRGNARSVFAEDVEPEARPFIATIEPMHGNEVVIYHEEGRVGNQPYQRMVIDDTVAQGHALACADVLGLSRDQIIAGWREPNGDNEVGIRIYAPSGSPGGEWISHDLDVTEAGNASGMACEDLQVADLDGDGNPEIIAAGRATKNVKIYWNKSE